MAIQLNNVTPESQNEIVTISKKQDKISKQELLELVKSLAVFDEDKEINLTKIAKQAGKDVRNFTKSKPSEIEKNKISIRVYTSEKINLVIRNSNVYSDLRIEHAQIFNEENEEVFLESVRFLFAWLSGKSNLVVNEVKEGLSINTKGKSSIITSGYLRKSFFAMLYDQSTIKHFGNFNSFSGERFDESNIYVNLVNYNDKYTKKIKQYAKK